MLTISEGTKVVNRFEVTSITYSALVALLAKEVTTPPAPRTCAICEAAPSYYTLTQQHQGRSVSTEYCRECFYTGPLGDAAKSPLPETDRLAMEMIISTPDDEEESRAGLRMESVISRAVAALHILETAFELSDRDDALHEQRVIGLGRMVGGLDAELLNYYNLMYAHSRYLRRQNTALRLLAGLPISAPDAACAEEDEGFAVARHAARNMTPAAPAKEGQVAA